MLSGASSQASILAFPPRDDARLRLAIRGLEQALEAQAVAMAGFRARMSELAGAVDGLRRGTEAYQQQLGTLSGQVGDAHAAARRLEGTVTRWLAAQG